MISVIVLSKNNGNTLDKCLKSIYDSEGEKEIIVVDAHSSDATPKILLKYAGKIEVIYDEGKGIGIARNLGVSHAKGRLICFVDADAFCSADHFVKIRECLSNDLEVGVIHVESVERISGSLPLTQRLEGKLRLARRAANYGLSHGELFAVGCFISLRRKVFEDVGGFWTFPPYGADDSDFSIKAVAKGWKIGRIRLKSWHRHRTSLKEWLREIWGLGKGRACWIKKWGKYIAKRTSKQSVFSRFFENYPLALAVAAYILSPIIASRYVIKTKTLAFYPFYITRQHVSLFGFLWGLATWARKITPVASETRIE
jgi:glycosyltransferase involved in cell wall biosynthesis